MKYRQLGNTGVLVSEICFGTMTFGGKGYWSNIGNLEQGIATELIKTSFDSGINFFDTANGYSEGLAEIMLGEAIKQIGIPRNELFIATKVRLKMGEGVNREGLSKTHIYDSVNESLDRMKLNHIDLLYIHGVDPLTPIEETMRGLEDVTRTGKVRYIGVSNHPAWQVMKANAYSDARDWNKFVAMQCYYSIAGRDVENDLVPLALDEKMSMIPWSPLAGGFLSGKFTRSQQQAGGDSRRDKFDFPPVDKESAYDIIDVMIEVAKAKNVKPAQVALAWLLKKPAVSSVIIGAKRLEQLKENIETINVSLDESDMAKLDEISSKPKPYPQWMVERQLGTRKTQK